MKRYAFTVLNLEKYWKILRNQNRAGKLIHAFVHRCIVFPKNAKHLFFYAMHPKRENREYIDLIECITRNAENLWKFLRHESLLSIYDKYQDLLKGRKKVTFIKFKNLKGLTNLITTKLMTEIVRKARISQMGMYIIEKMAHRLILEGEIRIKKL